MMDLTTQLNEHRSRKRKILSIFLTAGFPTVESTVAIAAAIERGGADILELGIPFSDPLADGPAIQRSSQIALQNGITIPIILRLVRDIRRAVKIPIVLMGYANPIYRYGMDRFLGDARSAGVDGMIIADLPLEESTEYRAAAGTSDIAPIFLASPTTSDQRLKQLDDASRGFLYCISVTGVTGTSGTPIAQTEEYLSRARAIVRKNPLLVGFGISTPDTARRFARICDGVVIGSALISAIQSSPQQSAAEKAFAFTSEIRSSLTYVN